MAITKKDHIISGDSLFWGIILLFIICIFIAFCYAQLEMRVGILEDMNPITAKETN